MVDLSKGNYTHEEVKRMLHMEEGSRETRFRYHLLDQNENFLSELGTVEGGEISFSAFSDIKRSARIDLREESYTQETYSTWSDIGDRNWSDL